MTRLELLTILVARARANGFELRPWYTSKLGLPWISAEAAIALLDQQRRYYALLFSHEFARAFWKNGLDVTFTVPEQTFQRTMPDGSIRTITRKAFQRKSSHKAAWQYHLREMAAATEPLRYLRRYLNVEDDLIEDEAPPPISPGDPPKRSGHKPKPLANPLPTDEPRFLRRPFP